MYIVWAIRMSNCGHLKERNCWKRMSHLNKNFIMQKVHIIKAESIPHINKEIKCNQWLDGIERSFRLSWYKHHHG